MRLIVRNRPSLHIWNVNDYIKQTQANIIKQDTNKYITLQKIFRKIYLRHLNDHQKIKILQNDLDNFVLISQAPARTIADYFYQKSKTYSEAFLKITFQAIARAYQISKLDNNGSLDTLGYKLFYSSQFFNLSEQLKYAIRNNKISYESVTSIIDSLIKLQYIDYEIMNLLILYTKRQIDGVGFNSMLTKWHGDREFQIEKKDYYNPKEKDQLQALRNSQEVSTAISFVKHIYQESQKHQQIIQGLKKDNIKEINKLVDEIIHTSQNFRKLVEGIINVRRQYLRMVQFSQNQKVLRNPNLNLQLLQIEQKLLATKLLTIEDIKNPKQIGNTKVQANKIQQILLRVLDVNNIDPIFAIVDKSQIEVIDDYQKFKPDVNKISTLLNGLAKLAELDRYVYHAADGKNLVSLKWEKTLLNSQGLKIPKNFDEQLNVSKIYRKIYKQVYQFIKNYDQKFQQIFKNKNFNDKIQIIDAYCRLGFHQNALSFIDTNDNNFTNNFDELSQDRFSSLVHVLNNIGIFIRSQSFHSAILQKITKSLERQQANTLHKPIRFSVDVANYLLQNHRNNENFRFIYERVLNLLQTKATYVTIQQKQNENIIQAFKILALQRPYKFGSHPIYLSYLKRLAHDQYKRNPYHSILREAVYKWANKSSSLKNMQNYLTIGVNNGIKNGVIFSNSDQTSLDGAIRTGDLNSYIVRLELKDGVKINQLSINQYLDINYSENEKIFQLKEFSQLKSNLNQLFQYQHQQFDHIYLQLQNNLVQIIKYYQPCLILDRIKFKLAVINQLRLHSTSIQTKQQEFSNKAKFLLQILEISKLINLLNEKNILKTVPLPEVNNFTVNDKLEKQKFQPQERDVIEVDVDTIKMLLKQVKNIIPNLLDSLTKYMSQQTLSFQTGLNKQKLHLQGQRQSIQYLQRQSSNKLDLTYEMINLRYYNDKTYCEYKDWKERISKKYQYIQLPYENATNLTKILANKLCGDITNTLNLLPLCKHQDRIQRLTIQFKVFSHQNQPQEPAPQTKSGDRQLQYIINLQTFKHQLKNYYSPKKLLDYIFGFKFIHDLNKRSGQKQKLVLTRNAEEYYNYLEELNDKSYLESAYAKFIISKLAKTDKIRFLLEQRKIIRVNLRILYQKGLINGVQYYNKINEFQNQIIEAVGELKTKMLDHMQDTLLSGEFKMLNIKKDELEAFQDIINKQIAYSRHFDEDFICANGNYQHAIHFKRSRAQNNYIKLYLLKKISENHVLDHREKHLLKKWHEDIIKNVSQFISYNEYTTIQIGDLSWQDLQQLKLKNSQLNINKDMLLIDLILEFNHFLDEGLIQSYERQVKAEYINKNFHIPSYLFDKTNNNSFKRLQVETQAAIANEYSKLTEKDLNKVEELFQIYKTQGFKERNRYQIFCKNFKDNITQMNDQIIRNQLIEEYIKHLQTQFFQEYNPELVSQIKERETDKLWRSVFQQTYDSCSKELLKEISKKIILRLQIIGENAPPFFGNMLLKLLLHPNIDVHSRESLIAAVQINHFNLNLDSADIESISKLPGKTIRLSNQAKNDLKTISKVAINKFLRQKVKAIQ